MIPIRWRAPWAVPGQAGFEHRVGGLEKSYETGDINYEPGNHHKMTLTRAERVAKVMNDIPDVEVTGPREGESAPPRLGRHLRRHHQRGRAGAPRRASRWHRPISRHLNPFPANLGEVLSRYDKVLVPELNNGQLSVLIRSQFLVDAIPFNKIAGQPFKITEITGKIDEVLGVGGPFEFEF